MGDTQVVYQLQIQLWDILLRDWKSEIITAKYFGVVAFIVIYYAIWWKLTDKRRISDLLLFGSFVAVMRLIIDISGVTAGLWFYEIRILPFAPSIFLHVLTITPLTWMLTLQYSPNWRQFFVWGAVAAAWVSFVLLPSFAYFGVYQMMNWNYIYSFLVSYGAGMLSRAAFHLVKQVQFKALEGYDSPLQSTLMQPAFKPTDSDNDGRFK